MLNKAKNEDFFDVNQARERAKEKTKGITLIALVITIIVLLILAAVSIATLTGENGILSKANTAKEETQREDVKEQAKLDIADYVTNDLANGGDGSITNEKIQEILTGKDYVQEAESDYFISKDNQKIEYAELYGKIGDTGGSLPSTENTKPYLPSSDFSQEAGTDLSTGLVIKEKETGNSYVWIEVPKSIYNNIDYTTGGTNATEAPTNAEDYNKIEKVLQNYAKDYRKTNYVDEWKSEEQHGFKSSTEYDNLKHKMLKSVYENGGFWIGQYEMGTETLRTSKNAELTDPVCKEGAYPYNYVTCKQAQEKASSMNSGECESSLMFGIQWDLVMKHIETKEGKIQAELNSDSTSWGNYLNATFTVTKGKYSTDSGKNFTEVSGSYTKPASITSSDDTGKILLTTGASEINRVLNIYDIAGNVSEWTLERYTANSNFPCGYRGGSYGYYGSASPFGPASSRDFYSTSDSYVTCGFRPALYK